MQQSLPNQDKYLQLLERIANLLPPVFIMGGFAEDALLNHRITRQHGDIDVLTMRNQLNQCLEQFKSLGFPAFEVYLEESPGNPFVLGADANDLHLEIGVGNVDPSGSYSFEVDGQAPSSRYRVFLPEDTLDYPATTLEGIPIHTISPLALYQMRAAFAVTGSFGEMSPNAVATQELLRKTFFADQDEGKLIPKIVNL
jgi:hypothetical protein